MSEPETPEKDRRRWFLLDRPELPVLLVLFLAGGVGTALVGFPASWSVPAKIVAGLGLGLTAMIALFANRMIGGRDYS
jgi:hypothetical protein